MEFLNVGIPEILFVLVIMLIIMGPKDMAENSRKAARWIRKVTQSDTWRMVRDTTNELRDLPNQLIREAGIEEWEQNVKNQQIQPGSGGNGSNARFYRSGETVPPAAAADASPAIEEPSAVEPAPAPEPPADLTTDPSQEPERGD